VGVGVTSQAAPLRRTPMNPRVLAAVQEDVAIAAYDPRWPQLFEDERDHLLVCLPRDLVGRPEHFGSTAVPGLAAKPIIDMLVEVASLERAKREIVPTSSSSPDREDGVVAGINGAKDTGQDGELVARS